MRFIVITLLMMTFSFPVFAQEKVSLRAGEHRGYTRLVFDWPGPVTYKVAEETDNFTVTFNKAASINADVTGKNVTGVSVVSENPLSIKVDVPVGAKSRSFPVSSRIVIDVYDPPAAAVTAEKAEKSPEKPAPAQKSQKTVSKNILSDKDQKDVDAAVKDVEDIVAAMQKADETQAQPKEVIEAEAEAAKVEAVDAPEPPAQRKLDEISKSRIKANMFTLSSTMSVGMAAFEDYGRLWMVVDREDMHVKPQPSGPDAEFFLPLNEVDVTAGQAYYTKTMPGANVRGQGGGLLWSIILSSEKGDNEPLAPKRLNIAKGKDRGGKIVFPFATARRVLDVKDPVTGSILKVVTVEDALDFAGQRRDFADFSVLLSPVGLAIRPKVDDLKVEITKAGVEISRAQGLSLLPEELVSNIEKQSFDERTSANKDERRIFNFDEWRLGGLSALNENRTIILSTMSDLSKGTQVENLITLAKMQLSNGRGAEALGFLEFAQSEIPELIQNPEFLSLRGVAEAFAWKTDAAFRDLNSPILKDYEEINIWKAFALADLGDWQQADEVLPQNMNPIKDYPPEIRNRLGIVLAEIYLRAGEVAKAEKILALIEKDKDKLNLAHDSALQYLKGEAARQKGDLKTTKALWEKLAEGTDDLYRVKAGLALTRLKVDNKELTPEKAIDALERLRYAWRGDELEAQINYWLGRTYFENGDYVKGLKIMRDAATLVPETVLGQRITGDMSSLFTDFYLSEGLAKVSPLDAVSLYEEFTELVPPGEKGNAVISNLAEHLVKADLLDRAANLLSYQINHRLSGDEAAKTATRLAAIQLIDKNAVGALQNLDKADKFLKALAPETATPARFNELSLLRARAMSLNSQTDRALKLLETLPPSAEVNRLRADIAWRNGFWDDAAYALEDVILDENVSLTRPLSDEHAMLILQRAVAQNLSGDRIGLANMREKYSDSMSQTNKARLFDVVTRARKNAGLADRETLLSTVSEVDLFGEFLESYKNVNGDKPSN